MPFRIFDRDRPGHPWESAFQEMSRPDPGRRWVVAANWRMDHRISEDREKGDLESSAHFQEVTDARTWWTATVLYFKEEICQPGSHSSYLRQTNQANQVPARVGGFDELVHVGSLNAMLRWVSRGDRADRTDAALQTLAGVGLPERSGADDWFDQGVLQLAQALAARGEGAVRQAAGLLCDAIGDTEPPWWAAFAEEVQTVLESGRPDDLCAALGLGHRAAGEWLVIWRYPASEALPLYRPTAIEANGSRSPCHFPSPPEYAFGITMPLVPSFAACREVLHRPLRGLAASERCTGKLLSLEAPPGIGNNDQLAAIRAGHRERLKKEFFTPGLDAWITRHPAPEP